MRLTVTILLTALAHAAFSQVELQSGQPITFEIPEVTANQLAISESFSISAGPSVRNLLVELTSDGNRDVDLYIKADSPFTAGTSTGLANEADYVSISPTSMEYVNVQDFAQPSVAGRTWYIVVAGFSGAASNAQLTATRSTALPPRADIVVDFDNPTGAADCNTAPWNDSAPFTPTAGNNATTLGEARRNAMLEAARLLSVELTSRVPVKIRACWDAFPGGDDGSFTLAGATTIFIFANSPGIRPDVIYSQSTATRLAGTDICRIDPSISCDSQEILITFNSEETDRFYLGLEPATQASGDSRDFVTIAMHEIGHGLGFQSFASQSGELLQLSSGQRLTDAYTRQFVALENGQIVPLGQPEATNAERAAAFVSFDNLLWADDQANVGEENTLLTFEAGLTRLEAPPTYNPGSSVSHVSNAYCELMRPTIGLCDTESIRRLGLGKKLLYGVGWADRPSTAPYVGLYYDRSRSGHGYDFQLGGRDADGNEIYILTFYTFRTLGGTPEWYQAVGIIDNGAFVPFRNEALNGMPRFLFDQASTPPQQADAETFSQTAISFNDPASAIACADGVGRPDAALRSSFQWAIAREVGEWCAEPLIPASTLPITAGGDFGGLWFAGVNDQGWGFSLENIVRDDGTTDLFVLLYVYAGDGTPVWFFGSGEDFQPDTPLTITMFQRTGFPRRSTFGNVSDAEAGSMTLTLTDPNAATGNLATVDVTYQGAQGGGWLRNGVNVSRLSLPRLD